MSELQAEAAPAAPEAAVIANSDVTPFEQTMGEVYDKLNQPRENGKFASRDEKPAEITEGAETSEPEQVEATTPTEEVAEPAKPAIQRPQSWSSDRDELWAKLPPEAQEIIAKRESEAHKRITEQGEVVKSVETIKPYLEPLQRASARMGLPPGKGLELLLAADDYLARDPVSAIQWLAERSGVDLKKFGQSEAPSENAEINALREEVSYLKRSLSDTSNHIQQREQRELQTQHQSLESLVADFAKGKDYWPEIETEIVAQIHAIRTHEPNMTPSEILAKAHDRALKLNEEVASRLTEAKRKEEEAKKAAEAKRKADEAKRQASLNVRSIDGKAPKPARKDMVDEMAEIYDRIAARG